MQNLKIKKAMTDLINLVADEEDLNVEYSIEAIIEQFQYDLKQERLYIDHIDNAKYKL
jgi:hypothetical protein